MSRHLRAMLMRGGTSKGLYFLAEDLPSDPLERNDLLLALMGSPDPLQIDGLGGGTSVTSKVAVVQPSVRDDADVDYLFLQVAVDQPQVSDGQTCGNILAGVGPFAIERGLVPARGAITDVRVHMVNTGKVATLEVKTPQGAVTYEGEARLDGVPGHHAAIPVYFSDMEGSVCGALLPGGEAITRIDDTDCTLIDNGMPCVLMRAADFGLTGKERPDDLDALLPLRQRLEAIRLKAGERMTLGKVADKSTPKMVLLSPPQSGGLIHTRCFIPHTCHRTIGLFAAVTVATACLMPGSVAADFAFVPDGEEKNLAVEHPTGAVVVVAQVKGSKMLRAGVMRTARKLFDGQVFAR